MDIEKRQTIFRRIPLILTAAAAAPNLLLPEKASALDLNYEPYEILSNKQLQKLLEKNNFPEQFDFSYLIPKNKDFCGNSLTGNFRLKRDASNTSLEIRAIHPWENKALTFFEEKKEKKIFYCEKIINFSGERETLDYENHFTYELDNHPPTLITLIENLIYRKPQETHFVFKGKDKNEKKYALKIKPVKSKEDCSAFEAQIKNNPLRVERIRVFYKEANCLKVPTEVWVDYKVRILKIISDAHTIKGVLQE